MKVSEIRQLVVPKLWQLLQKLRLEVAREKILLKTGQSVRVAHIGDLKKQIARVKTVLTEKQS